FTTNGFASSHNRGNSLLITVGFIAVLSIGVAGYLNLTNSQTVMSRRSQTWNKVLPIVEAGVDEALEHLNYSVNYGNTLIAQPNLAANGWSLQTNQYVKTRDLGGGSYVVNISMDAPPVITSSGFVNAPYD